MAPSAPRPPSFQSHASEIRRKPGRSATRRRPSPHRRAPGLILALGLLHSLFGAVGAVRGQSTGDGRADGVSAADTAAVSDVLDAFHDAASRADGARYFDLFAEGGVFIGTDPGERWTLAEFREYARPFFQRGRGWTYVPMERHVRVSRDGSTAWFDEMLHNDGLGLTRGTGVLVREGGSWRVAQYHLTIPVPNALAGDVVEMIREHEER